MESNNPILDAALMVYEENIEMGFKKLNSAIETNLLMLMLLSKNEEEEKVYTKKCEEILKKKFNEIFKMGL